MCGCWQVLAIERYRQDLTRPETPASLQVGYYASSLTVDQRPEAELLAAVRNHWSAMENGTHYRRDVTLGEDACRVRNRHAAAVLASLRNLANGLYELQRARGRTKADTLKSWCGQQTFTTLWPLLNR